MIYNGTLQIHCLDQLSLWEHRVHIRCHTQSILQETNTKQDELAEPGEDFLRVKIKATPNCNITETFTPDYVTANKVKQTCASTSATENATGNKHCWKNPKMNQNVTWLECQKVADVFPATLWFSQYFGKVLSAL